MVGAGAGCAPSCAHLGNLIWSGLKRVSLCFNRALGMSSWLGWHAIENTSLVWGG